MEVDPINALFEALTFFILAPLMVGLAAIPLVIPYMICFGGTSPEEMYEYHKVLNNDQGAAGEAYRADLHEWMQHASLDDKVEFLRLTSEGEE